MTSGFVGSTTMTVFSSTTLVSTFCCSLDFRAPLSCGLLPHPLDGVHDVVLLVEEGVPELRRPLDVVREPLHDVGNRRHRLDARVPGLLRDRVGERLVLQVLVLREPLLELDDLERVGRRDERLGQERVGVERDRAPPASRAGPPEVSRPPARPLGRRLLRSFLCEEDAFPEGEERDADNGQQLCGKSKSSGRVETKWAPWLLLRRRIVQARASLMLGTSFAAQRRYDAAGSSPHPISSARRIARRDADRNESFVLRPGQAEWEIQKGRRPSWSRPERIPGSLIAPNSGG